MFKIIVVIFCLIASLTANGLCAEKKENKPSTTIPQPPYGPDHGPGHNAPMPGQIYQSFYMPSSSFADINNNNILESDELKAFEAAKFQIFDIDQSGALDKKEIENFDLIDFILSRGGENFSKLSDEQIWLYKEWRSFVLSLKINNPNGGAIDAESFAKCYPDKICDESPGQPGNMPHP